MINPNLHRRCWFWREQNAQLGQGFVGVDDPRHHRVHVTLHVLALIGTMIG